MPVTTGLPAGADDLLARFGRALAATARDWFKASARHLLLLALPAFWQSAWSARVLGPRRSAAQARPPCVVRREGAVPASP